MIYFADYFQKSTFLKNYFRNTNRVSNSLDPVQTGHFVGPDLGTQTVCKSYQQMTKVATSRERVNDIQLLRPRGYVIVIPWVVGLYVEIIHEL